MNKMKRILTIVLTLALIVTMMPMNLTNVNAKSTTRLSSKKIVLQVGKTKKLKVKNKPAGVKVVWKSSKKKVATVSKKGKVKAKKPGKTTITAKVGKKKYKCKVIVKRKNSIKVTKPSDNNNSVINQVTTKSEPSQIVTTKAEVKTTKTETTKKNDSTTVKPTVAPTTVAPTAKPTVAPTTVAPTTAKPTVAPTTVAPTLKPTVKPTTVAPTLKPTAKPTTVAPTTANGNVDESIKAPEGLVWAGNANLPYYFAWAPVVDVDSYNVYVDGVYATNVGASSVNLDKAVFTKGSGEYTIGVASVKNNKISSITSIKYTYAGSGQQATTKTPEVPTVAPTQQPTVAPTTVKPTTAKPTTIPKETTNISFTTDSSIEKPFGLDVSQASVGYVNIVWGRGSIDCYNVYVDGERRRTGISAQALRLPVYTEGTHTIAITTVVGKRESERLETQIQITGIGEKETEPETCPEELKPQLKENVPLRDDRIAIELNNKTNGKYSDSEIYWCIVGNNENNQLCYMDKDGNMIPASESLNTVEVNGTKYANIYHTLAESDHVYAPTIRSGRMYLSYGKPVYVKFVGSTGYAGPDLNNPGDVNANTLFEFAEFTIEGKHYWGNTTRVDYFCFPMITRLIGGSLYGGYDNVVGDVGTRDEIFNAFKNEVPNEYKSLVRDDRIIAPCKSTFNVGKTNGNYFDNYINEFWNKYANEDLRFSSESGSFVGRVVGNQMRFTREGDSTVYYVDKPNTQEVLEGKGAFDRGNGVEKAIEAQLCAAFNRGVATEPDKWYTPSQYYKNSVANFYAGFFHEHSVLGKAYGFCYDDVNDQSTLLQYDKADALVIDLKW